jgi:hypothetical protein
LNQIKNDCFCRVVPLETYFLCDLGAADLIKRKRGGRPRLAGNRKPSGDLIRVADDPMAVVMEQRRKNAVASGISLAAIPTNAKERIKARKADRIVLLDQKNADALGRASMRGLITDRQYRAGVIFGQRYYRMARVMGWPSPHVKAVDLGAAHGLSLKTELDESAIQATKESYYEIESWLLENHDGGLGLIHSFVILDFDLSSHAHNMQVAKACLGFLADKLGLQK